MESKRECLYTLVAVRGLRATYILPVSYCHSWDVPWGTWVGGAAAGTGPHWAGTRSLAVPVWKIQQI